MQKHKDDLRHTCDGFLFTRRGPGNGSQRSGDGDVCHQKIVEHNMKNGLQDGCLTCEKDDRVKLKMSIDVEPVDATYLQTTAKSNWYRRSGIVGALPTQFSCDESYKSHSNFTRTQARQRWRWTYRGRI